jgi:hypothetical protein
VLWWRPCGTVVLPSSLFRRIVRRWSAVVEVAAWARGARGRGVRGGWGGETKFEWARWLQRLEAEIELYRTGRRYP